MTWAGAGKQIRAIFRALRVGTQLGATRIFWLLVAASVVWFRRLLLWQNKDELQAFASISDGVTRSVKLQSGENKHSNLEKILGNRAIEFCY